MEHDKEKLIWEVTELMTQLGIPAHLRGYYYLREAVVCTVEDMELVGRITKLLYPTVGKRFKCSPGRVERAIRNGIEISWERGNQELLGTLFGYTKEDQKKRPTNSEYILVLSDYIRQQL